MMMVPFFAAGSTVKRNCSGKKSNKVFRAVCSRVFFTEVSHRDGGQIHANWLLFELLDHFVGLLFGERFLFDLHVERLLLGRFISVGRRHRVQFVEEFRLSGELQAFWNHSEMVRTEHGLQRAVFAYLWIVQFHEVFGRFGEEVEHHQVHNGNGKVDLQLSKIADTVGNEEGE